MTIPLGDARYEATNWKRLDAHLLHKFPGMLKPWELDELTIAEFAWLIEYDPSTPDPFGGRGVAMGSAAVIAELQRWHKLTPRQQLEALDG